MIHLYSLLSHDGRCLPYQITACRKYVEGLGAVTVTQGPLGHDPRWSGGPTVVRPEVAERCQLQVVDVPPDSLGQSFVVRIRAVNDWVLTELIPKQQEPFALVLAGDVLPVKGMNAEDVLDGHDWAMRSDSCGHGRHYAWFLLRRDATCHVRDLRNLESVKAYPSSVYRKEDHVEWFDPCWLHLDKISLGAITDAKLDLAAEFVPEAVNQSWCYEVPDPPRAKPRAPAHHATHKASQKRRLKSSKHPPDIQPLMKICEGCASSYMDDKVLLCKHVDMPHGKNCLRSRISRYMSILAMKNCPEGKFK